MTGHGGNELMVGLGDLTVFFFETLMTLRFYDSVKGMKKCKAEKYSHFFSFFP